MKNNNVKFKESIIAAALFLMVPMLVFGQTAGTVNKSFSIGPRASYATPVDADKGHWFVGAQARLLLSPGLGVEGSIDYRRNDFNENTRIKTYPVQASLLAYLMPDASLNPFLLGGGGWYFTDVEGPAGFSQTDSRFGLHAGAGLEIKVNESVSLDGTYRYVWLEDVSSKDENALDKTYDDSGSMLTVAVNLLF